jgi:hypothetical protein
MVQSLRHTPSQISSTLIPPCVLSQPALQQLLLMPSRVYLKSTCLFFFFSMIVASLVQSIPPQQAAWALPKEQPLSFCCAHELAGAAAG